MDDIQKSLIKSLQRAIESRSTFSHSQVISIRATVTGALVEWFRQHPGIEDHTVECVDCHKPMTKANLIEPLCREDEDAPTYLCERCCEVRRQIIANAIG